MKKIWIIVVVAIVAAVAIGTTGFIGVKAFASQVSKTAGMYGYNNWHGVMMKGNRDGFMRGILHDKVVAIFAEKFGITVDDLSARLDGGETMAEIAYSFGYSSDQFFTLMEEVRDQAIDQALSDGTLTQEQADWMKERGNGWGMHSGRRGKSINNYAGCPYTETDD